MSRPECPLHALTVAHATAKVVPALGGPVWFMTLLMAPQDSWLTGLQMDIPIGPEARYIRNRWRKQR